MLDLVVAGLAKGVVKFTGLVSRHGGRVWPMSIFDHLSSTPRISFRPFSWNRNARFSLSSSQNANSYINLLMHLPLSLIGPDF